jgi:hypothetical protein
MAMRQICHAGQMLLGLTDILARKEGAFGQASLPDLTAITLLIKAIALTVNIFFLLVGVVLLFLQVFLWEACQDMTLVILIIAAVISLVLGIATEVNSFSLCYVFSCSFYAIVY